MFYSKNSRYAAIYNKVWLSSSSPEVWTSRTTHFQASLFLGLFHAECTLKLVVQIVSHCPQPCATGSALLTLPSKVYPRLLALLVWSQRPHIDEQCARKSFGAACEHVYTRHCASQIMIQRWLYELSIMNDTLILLFKSKYVFILNLSKYIFYHRLADCPDGFTYLDEGCYQVILKSLDFKSSTTRCHELHSDAHLAVIDSAKESNDLIAHIRSLTQGLDSLRLSVFILILKIQKKRDNFHK